jgi:competence protein ComEC
MRRPLLNIAVVYGAGILVGDYFHVGFQRLLVAAVAMAIVAAIWARLRWVFVLCGFLFLGWANMNFHTAVVSPSDLRALLSDKPEYVTVRGTLRQSPTEHIFERHNEEAMRTVAYVDVAALARGTNWQPACGQLIVMTPGMLPEQFYSGQHVAISGVIQQPSGPFAEGLFDSKSFLKRKGIYFQLRAASTNDWLIAGAATAKPWSDRFAAYAKNTLAIGLDQEDLPLRLIWTLVLDWKAPMTPGVEEPFVKAGTFHIFAVDGLRIGLITAMLVTFFQVLRVPRALAGFITIPTIWFYAGLTGFPASAIRASVMATLVVAGWALKRPSDLINSLFTAALIILLCDPQQLFQPGFQLSFVVVLCIVLVLPIIRTWIGKPFEPDPLIPKQIVAQQFWYGGWIAHPRKFFVDTLAISLAAWLGSIPLSAQYFHVFNIVSTPANFVVVPMTAFTLVSCLASLLTGFWAPGIAGVFNHASWALMKGIILISQWCVQWRPSAVNVSAPTLLTTIWYYAVLLALLTGWIFRSKYKRIVISALACLSLLCVVQWLGPRPIKLHVLPLSGGQCVLVDSGGLKTDLLIDCGDEAAVERVTKPFLQAHGVNWLNRCCLSVAHANAVGGAELIETNFHIGRFVTSPARSRSVVYKAVIAKLDHSPDRRNTIASGDTVDGWRVMHPEADDQFARGDDNAVVLQRQFGKSSVVLLSTLGRAGQQALAERRPDLRADIVIAGLPATEEPLCRPLLDVLQPKLIVIVDSEFPATRRASEPLRLRLANSGARVIYCRDAGALMFAFKPDKWELTDAAGQLLDVKN